MAFRDGLSENGGGEFVQYQDDPVGYARDVLRVNWWGKQKEVAEKLLIPPYKVLVKASHSVGKTHLGGGLVNWWFDSFVNSITLTTAPSDRQVKDLLWKEVRTQRRGRGGFPGPKMPRLEHAHNYFAHGFTAKDANAFQGHHAERMLFVFDEAVGIDSMFWESAQGMFGGEDHAWLAIFNPTDTSSQAYAEELSGNWHTVSISMLEHPNILAEHQGLRAPYPAAIRYNRVNDLVKEWCTSIPASDRKATDIEWPPESGQWMRPGPLAESRMLGRWPSQATYNVWSDAAWERAEKETQEERPEDRIEIGCDVARFGDDFTEIHVRRGPVSLWHESHNGWSTTQTAGQLKRLAQLWGEHAKQAAHEIRVKVDDDGVGGGVTDQRGEYTFLPISAASRAFEQEKYPNRRSELWFDVASRADKGRLDLTRIPEGIRRELRRQAMAPTWRPDSSGRRVVEGKEQTKKRIKRSPDGMDAMNLAYAPVMSNLVDFI